MLTYRVRNIGIAAALALLAAMFTFFYVSNYKHHVQQGEELVDVYVASHDIPAGTSGAEAAGGLTHKRVERTAVVPARSRTRRRSSGWTRPRRSSPASR